MAKYIGKRVFYMIITLFLIAVLTFVLMKILPGSPFDTERFEKLTPQQQQEALAKYDLECSRAISVLPSITPRCP